MSKTQRRPQQLFSIVMWVLSFVFASFLMGLGGLIIQDLPRVDSVISVQQYADTDALEAANAILEQEQSRLLSMQRNIEDAQQNFLSSQADYQLAQTAFETWVATRTATESEAQNPQVLARSQGVEELKAAERSAQRLVTDAQSELLRAERAVADARSARSNVLNDAQPAYQAALSAQQLRVFLLRLALTLPLLLLAAWAIIKKRKSAYWPLFRGFSIFAIFAFFVELVPYLPSYGGYVRYVVGIVIVALSGHFIIRGMRRYLERKQMEETRSEGERRQSIEYETAMKKIAASTCPGCDRKIAEREDINTDFCVHCGIRLHCKCESCNARNSSFHRFCLSCGVPQVELAFGDATQ